MAVHKITVRANEVEYGELQKRARGANLSLNQYLIQAALNPVPRNDRQLSDLMGQLCRLENLVLQENDLAGLRRTVRTWRFDTIKMIGG